MCVLRICRHSYKSCGSSLFRSSSGNSNTIDKSFIKLAYQRLMDYLRRLLSFKDEENLDLFLVRLGKDYIIIKVS